MKVKCRLRKLGCANLSRTSLDLNDIRVSALIEEDRVKDNPSSDHSDWEVRRSEPWTFCTSFESRCLTRLCIVSGTVQRSIIPCVARKRSISLTAHRSFPPLHAPPPFHRFRCATVTEKWKVQHPPPLLHLPHQLLLIMLIHYPVSPCCPCSSFLRRTPTI